MRQIQELYSMGSDVLNTWMEKLFPSTGAGCLNFGFWDGIKEPLNLDKRLQSQKNFYFEIFKKIQDAPCRVLEVGCGRGHGIAWLTDRKYLAFGVDPLESQISKCKKEYPTIRDRYKIGKAESLPFEGHFFECVISLEAAQHFSDFQLFCNEAYRVLNRKGKIIISTFFYKAEEHIEKCKEIIPDNSEGLHNAIAISNALSCLKDAGFLLNSPISIGMDVFPFYSKWQKMQLGQTPVTSLSEERLKWKDYYTGGGASEHPWQRAFNSGWMDYYILEAVKPD